MRTRQPMQPLYRDREGVTRFRENAIVRFLLDWSSPKGMGMNDLALMQFSKEDRQQFAQLIGYSLSGYGELPYVTPPAFQEAADAEAEMTHARKKAKKRR